LAGLLALSSLLLLAAVLVWPKGRHAVSIMLGMRHSQPHTEVLAGVDLVAVALGFQEITDIQFVPGQLHRAVILQKDGKARGAALPAPGAHPIADATAAALLIDVAVRTDSELGLLGLAFHPNYQQNGLFYLNYNPLGGERRTRVAEWYAPAAELGAGQARERRVLLEVELPYSNHHGGQMVFGPDGFLYIALGDGGSDGDPANYAQNLGSLLGKTLRIDVNGRESGMQYAVPKDNPFVGRAGVRPEVWAYGMRNPWRFSFDPQARMVIADVGQDAFEEIDLVARGSNLGWNIREGRHCYAPKQGCGQDGLLEPIFDYGRNLGQSVTGGFVYTSNRLRALTGQYIFADFVSGNVWSMTLPAIAQPTPARLLGRFPRSISTFGRDTDGEVYAGDFVSGDVLAFMHESTQ
jgi:glucose/arabinose dehydrogenase